MGVPRRYSTRFSSRDGFLCVQSLMPKERMTVWTSGEGGSCSGGCAWRGIGLFLDNSMSGVLSP